MNIFLYFILFLLISIVSYYLGMYLRMLSVKVAKIDFNRKLQDESPRWRSSNKPLVGGIVFFILFLLSVIGFFVLNIEFPELPQWYSETTLMLIVGGFIGFAGGLYDDVNYLPALTKLGIQISVGVLSVYIGLKINLFPSEALNDFLTVFWVVGIMNSINMLDNMDGVAGSLAFTLVVGALGMEILHPTFHPLWGILWLIMAATLFGYLLINKPPAKIYMGDSGSQFLGVLLAFIGLKYFWNFEVSPAWDNWQLLFLAVLPFIVLVSDTTFVVFGRLSRKKSPIVGGRDHISHMLILQGVPEKRIFVLLSAFNSSGIILYFFLIHKSATSLRGLLGILFFGILFGVLLYFYIKNYYRSEYAPSERKKQALIQGKSPVKN